MLIRFDMWEERDIFHWIAMYLMALICTLPTDSCRPLASAIFTVVYSGLLMSLTAAWHL